MLSGWTRRMRSIGLASLLALTAVAAQSTGDRAAAVAPDFAAAIGVLGEPVVGPGTTTYDAVSVASSFLADGTQRLTVELSGDDGALTLRLTAPRVDVTFDARTYPLHSAVDEDFRAALWWETNVACQAQDGSFELVEYEHAPDWTVTSLVLRWHAGCGTSTAWNSGVVRYRSDRPVTAFEAQPPFASFGQQMVDTNSRERVVRFENVGPSASVPTIGVGATPEFAIVDDRCSSVSIAPGGSCNVSVQFRPRAVGAASVDVVIIDDTFPQGGGASATLSGVAVEPGTAPDGEFTGLTPARILDTRVGVGAPVGRVGAGSWTTVQVAGRGGVPDQGVSAVVMNVTAVRPTAPTYVSVLPRPTVKPFPPNDPIAPAVSNLNAAPGTIVANMVTVAIDDTDGTVAVYNDSGATHLLFDVVGYYSNESGPEGSRYVPFVPERLFDTRSGLGIAQRPVGAGRSVRFDVGAQLPELGTLIPGVTGSPTAVVLNVTIARPTAWSFLTVHPGDVPTPTASHLNYVPGQRVANLVTVRLPASGIVEFHNEFGSTDLIVDLVGMYHEGDFEGGRFRPFGPVRVADTRVDLDQEPLRPGEELRVRVTGIESDPPIILLPDRSTEALVTLSIPSTATAAVTNVTAVRPTEVGYFTVLPPDECDVPDSSNVNFAPGQRVANQAIATLSAAGGCGPGAGWASVFNPIGETHAIVDVFGYFR